MLNRDKLVRQAVLDRFVATLTTGATFEGLLYDADEKTFRFADAFAIDGRNRVKVDGDLFLPREKVLWLQRPGVSE